MKCPYQVNFDCQFVDTLDMVKLVKCPDCKYYDNGIRPTGATPLIGWIIGKFRSFKKKKYEPTDNDIFMMGL